jgi:hypothetical protein
MRLIDADALNGYKFGLISPYAQNLFHKTINEAPTIDYKQLLEQEPCADAISRQAVLEIIRKCHCEEWIKADIGASIEALSPVTPAEKVGHWIFVDEAHEHARCSKCDYGDVDLMDGKSHNYCQNCGAKM